MRTAKEIAQAYAKAYRSEFEGPLDSEWSGTGFCDLSESDQKLFAGGWDEFNSLVIDALNS